MDGLRITRRIAIDVRGAWPVPYQYSNGPFERVYATLTILAYGRSNRLNSDRSQDLWSWIRSCTVVQCLPVRQGHASHRAVRMVGGLVRDTDTPCANEVIRLLTHDACQSGSVTGS